MISVHLRPVDDDGVPGAAIGSAFRRDERVIYEGSSMLPGLMAAAADRFGVDEVTVLARLFADGWSNGKMTITADAG
jgi:hypothetical protein